MLNIKNPKYYLILLFLITTNIIFTSDYKHLFETQNQQTLFIPKNVEELLMIVHEAKEDNKKISIVGAYKSQGGQTISSNPQSYRINLEEMNKVISLNTKDKEIIVQAGMTWRELQHYISIFGLSVKAMQSYNDFSIGGSLSVNAHGQDLVANPIITSVKSFKLITPQGKIINVSRTENSKLFGLAIGGYGLFGIIPEATLQLTKNSILERHSEIIDAKNLAEYFVKHIRHNNRVEFYSARFSIGSSDMLEKAIVLTYERTEKFSKEYLPLKIVTTHCFLSSLMTLMKKFPPIKNIRFELEKAYCKLPQVVTRNNFMSYSISCLPQNDDVSYILQEYFIPYQNLNEFINFLREIIKSYNINILNLTARHICKNSESILSYSMHECCALVLYLNIKKNNNEYTKIVEWTRKLIDKTLMLSGSYYLPYHLLATHDQIRKIYPRFNEFICLKKFNDPQEMFTNKFYEHYKN